jgi:hypothetical protein
MACMQEGQSMKGQEKKSKSKHQEEIVMLIQQDVTMADYESNNESMLLD